MDRYHPMHCNPYLSQVPITVSTQSGQVGIANDRNTPYNVTLAIIDNTTGAIIEGKNSTNTKTVQPQQPGEWNQYTYFRVRTRSQARNLGMIIYVINPQTQQLCAARRINFGGGLQQFTISGLGC